MSIKPQKRKKKYNEGLVNPKRLNIKLNEDKLPNMWIIADKGESFPPENKTTLKTNGIHKFVSKIKFYLIYAQDIRMVIQEF